MPPKSHFKSDDVFLKLLKDTEESIQALFKSIFQKSARREYATLVQFESDLESVFQSVFPGLPVDVPDLRAWILLRNKYFRVLRVQYAMVGEYGQGSDNESDTEAGIPLIKTRRQKGIENLKKMDDVKFKGQKLCLVQRLPDGSMLYSSSMMKSLQEGETLDTGKNTNNAWSNIYSYRGSTENADSPLFQANGKLQIRPSGYDTELCAVFQAQNLPSQTK